MRRNCRWGRISVWTKRASRCGSGGGVWTCIANARLDVWQANDDGFYDGQQKGIQPDFNLREVFRTNAQGEYWFKGGKPKFYPIPADGPVAQLMDALGWHPF